MIFLIVNNDHQRALEEILQKNRFILLGNKCLKN